MDLNPIRMNNALTASTRIGGRLSRGSSLRGRRPGRNPRRSQDAFLALFLALSCLCLWGAPLRCSAQFVISEFMAANQRSLNDEDGSNSDWIEIHNTG
jgi:hypothetical protein